MVYEISNDNLRVKVNSLGSELVSVENIEDGYEYIYQPTAIWQGQAKNLFPNIGLINEGYVFIRGDKFPLCQHGFAKDMQFQISKRRNNFLQFTLKSNENTKKFVPYNFIFNISFLLLERSIEQKFSVENLDEEEMFFALGSHTGFTVSEGSNLNFEANANLLLIERENMQFLTGRVERYTVTNGKKELRHNTFNHGADILTGFNKKIIHLNNYDGKHSVSVDFTDFQYLALWAPPDSNIAISIMPWCGLPDEKETSHKFEEKVGNVRLTAKAKFSVSQRLTFSK